MIDKEGRLFGKINVIDLLVLLAVLLVAVGLFYREQGGGAVLQTRTVTLQVLCPFVYPEVAESVKAGDQLVASGSLVPAYIKKVEVKPARTTISRPDGSLEIYLNPFRKDIFLEIEGQTTAVSDAQISLGGQQVRAGKEDYYVKTRTVELEATILKVEVK